MDNLTWDLFCAAKKAREQLRRLTAYRPLMWPHYIEVLEHLDKAIAKAEAEVAKEEAKP